MSLSQKITDLDIYLHRMQLKKDFLLQYTGVAFDHAKIILDALLKKLHR